MTGDLTITYAQYSTESRHGRRVLARRMNDTYSGRASWIYLVAVNGTFTTDRTRP